eukprot:tig00001657_g9541.t1
MSGGERKRKDPPVSASDLRASTAESSAEGDATAGAAKQLSFDQLPDEILPQILECLGLQHAAAARAVCRRLREAAEVVVWYALDVGVRSARSADLLCGQLAGAPGQGLEGTGRRRWIRVAPGASLRLRAPWVAADGLTPLLSACAAASGGLRGVDAEVLATSAGLERELGGLLAALLPPGAADCPALRALSVRSDTPYPVDALPSGPAAQFLAAVAPLLCPFSAIESLALPACWPLDRPAAAVLSARLPRLKRLDVALGEAEAARGVATALPGLELRIHDNQCLTAADLRLLPRLPALQALRGPFRFDADVRGKDVAALRECPALRSLGPLDVYPQAPAWWEGFGPLPLHLSALAAALPAAPDLHLALRSSLALPAWVLPALLALAGAARGRLELDMEVDLAPGRPAEVAAALAPHPPRRLVLRAGVEAGALREGRLEGLAAFAACSRHLEARPAPSPRPLPPRQR